MSIFNLKQFQPAVKPKCKENVAIKANSDEFLQT